MENLFGDVYDKKRLAPGQIRQSGPEELQHDCSTLGGNSGSVVLDLATGDALGIHFAGRFLEANYAVSASVIEGRLRALRCRHLRVSH
jgi:endonuclease G